MDFFVRMMQITLNLLNMPITLYGHTFTYANVIQMIVLAGVVFVFLRGLLVD